MTDQPVILGGRYELEEVIGRGGMAEVWRAHDQRLGREVAVKRLRVDLATDQTFQARFQREAQSAAGLNHPNIVSVYDTGEMTDPMTGIEVPYIVMELVEGKTLRDMLREGIEITPRAAFTYGLGILEALSYSHARNIVHRDIKPANIMITPNNKVKVMDFGIARAVADTSATMTQTAAVIGTAQYLSPEQAKGEQVDARSDIYSTGCLLYELLTKRPPFVGDSPVSVAYQHVRESPAPPSTINSRVTPGMDAIVMKALSKDPASRYQSSREMHDDCNRMLGGQRTTAPLPASASAPTQVMASAPTRALPPEEDPDWDQTHHEAPAVEEKPKKKRKVSPATWVLVALLVLVVGALGFFVWSANRNDPTEDEVMVPSVIGFQEEAATQQLKKNQLVPKVEYEAGDASGKGTVIRQDPVADTSVQVGSTVTITVNSGAPVSIIPSGLIGATQQDATKMLKDAGFTDINILDAAAGSESPTFKKGDVVEVAPEQGTEVSTSQQVTLYVATGSSTIPNVIGATQDDALARLKEAGYENVEVREKETNDSPEGTVVSVLPDIGNTYGRSERVIIEVAKPLPQPSTTPSATPSSTSTGG